MAGPYALTVMCAYIYMYLKYSTDTDIPAHAVWYMYI